MTDPPLQPVSLNTVPELLRSVGAVFGAGTGVEVFRGGELERSEVGADFGVRVRWEGAEYRFVAEFKARSTPRVVEEAIRGAQRLAARSGLRPMVVVPYLSGERLDRLVEEGVSGLDLCGNGVVVVPGELLLRREGRPNRYPETRPARFAYRGATSLVPRVFLRRGVYGSVGEIREEVRAAGAAVALSTVSKALARMTEDLVLERSERGIRVLQPEKLLDLLTGSFAPPRAARVERAKLGVSLPELFGSVNGVRVVMSGVSSAEKYAAGMRAEEPIVYCEDLGALRERAGSAWRPVERFADIVAVETADAGAYFDARRDGSGVVYASPVQTYLELMTDRDRRDREIAKEVRGVILRECRSA